MNKMYFAVALLLAATSAVAIFSNNFSKDPVTVADSQMPNCGVAADSSAVKYNVDEPEYYTGYNYEDQYDILYYNDLYGHDDYGDYVPAKDEYVNGFPVVNGEKTYDKYYGTDGYIYPGESEKSREDWNLHDFHKNGEYFETFGNGRMSFYNEEHMNEYKKQLEEEYGKENIYEIKLDDDASFDGSSASYSGSGSGADTGDVQDVVDDVNQRTDDIYNTQY